MSFYVLDFCNHEFTTCENQDDVVNKIHALRKRNVSDDLITVINRDIDSVEMDLPAYWELEKSLRPNSDDAPDKCPVCGATLEGHGDEHFQRCEHQENVMALLIAEQLQEDESGLG